MGGFFTWLTEGVRRAIVRGVEQAASDINEAGGDNEIVVRLPAYREPARLPEPELDRQPATNGRRKAVRA